MKKITLDIDPGQLVVVIGTVGAGKTCLLHAVLNEIETTSGQIVVSGTTSYAPQESWCFSGSIRDNILLGSQFDSARYDSVIKVCGLERDMTLFPNGDSTFVGEKGYSLSGGQKARVTLARAVYNQADVYSLDDPLSAVDPRVSNHIFDRCIKEYLKNKTVILVTHQLQFLTKADKIVVLKDGEAIAMGNYDQLINSSIDFLAFLEKEEKEKETLSKKKSLSINHGGEGDDGVPAPNGGLTHTVSGRSAHGQSFHGKSFQSNCTTASSFSNTNPFKRQFSRTVSISRSRTSSLSTHQSASFHGDEEVVDTVIEELGQGMTRDERAKDGSINARVYWDYLR